MSGSIFADGIIDVHIANGVARITLGAATGQAAGSTPQEARPSPSGLLVIPVVQLPVFARVFAEVTRQVEQRAKEAMAQAQAQAEAAAPEGSQAPSGAFRFNG